MNGKAHSVETKAAVMAALLAGQAASEIARKYNISEGTVRSWKARQAGHPVASVATRSREQIGDLIVNYLEELLVTLHAQQKVFQDEKWLRQQSASEIAVLHGVLADKGFRLLEALADREEDDTVA